MLCAGTALVLASACGVPAIDCREYELGLRSLSPAVELVDAGVATVGNRSTDWLIAFDSSQGTKLVSLDKKSRTSTELTFGDLARPVSLFGLEDRALMMTGSTLSVIAADLRCGPVDERLIVDRIA